MPCLTYDPPSSSDRDGKVESLKKQIAELEATLCAAMHLLEDHAMLVGAADAIQMLDLAEAGVSEKKVRSWWKAHQKKDEARRAAAQAAFEKERLRQAALGKLSPAEREALGVK